MSAYIEDELDEFRLFCCVELLYIQLVTANPRSN